MPDQLRTEIHSESGHLPYEPLAARTMVYLGLTDIVSTRAMDVRSVDPSLSPTISIMIVKARVVRSLALELFKMPESLLGCY